MHLYCFQSFDVVVFQGFFGFVIGLILTLDVIFSRISTSNVFPFASSDDFNKSAWNRAQRCRVERS